ACTAHAAAGGGMPDASLTVVLTAIVAWASASLADRARGTLGIMATLGAAQLLMHLVLSVLNQHHHHGVVIDPAAMTLAHVLATVLTAVLVARAEDGLILVAASLRRRRLLPTRWSLPAPSTPRRTFVAAPKAGAGILDVLLSRVCAPRGPPLTS
ncbi:MAG: hypothetical protein ACRDJ9_36510, partial [Dehalococcoidia bacterium]